jgi:hypothetical protein
MMGVRKGPLEDDSKAADEDVPNAFGVQGLAEREEVFRNCVRSQRVQFAMARLLTLRNSRSLFETSVSLRATACEAMRVSSGPIGVPARSSFARTAAYAFASSDVKSRIASGRRKDSNPDASVQH